MPKIDTPVKRLMQERPQDWIAYLLPGHAENPYRIVNPEKVPKAQSRMDSLWQIGEEPDHFFLHLEPQGYLDPAFPARMLRYRADTWEYTLSQSQGTPSIRQAALFLYAEHDNMTNHLVDTWDDDKTFAYDYRVYRAWEMDKGPVLEKKLLALYPLLPLMKAEPGETPEQVMEATVKVIGEVDDLPLKADLMAAVYILSEKRYALGLIKKIVRREMLMESQLLKEWTAEERKEAAAAAIISNSISIILSLLDVKFGDVPKIIKEEIGKITDPDFLHYLSTEVIRAGSLEEFVSKLKKQ